MLDFEIARCSRRCAKTDKELAPGEEFYSVLVAEGADVIRRDYSSEAWDGPPDDAVGWWKSRVPEPNARTMHWAPRDVMLHFFDQLKEDTQKADLRYVLALLMLRRRILRLEETETDPDGREVLVLYCPRNENEYRTPVCPPDEAGIRAIREELAKLLQADAT